MTEPPEATQSELLLPNGVKIRGPISTIVHNYRFFYFLANEMAYLARQAAEQYKSDPEKHTPLDEYRYSIASVIFSFTFVEGYINHLMHSPDSPGTQMFDEMSKNLRESIERLSLLEKVEYIVLHYSDSKLSKLDRSGEPFQSFDLLRLLRNFLIHYKPRREPVSGRAQEDFMLISEEDYKKEATKLERKVSGKFAFNQDFGSTNPFVYRCFSKDCARWSFEVSRNFVQWMSEVLSIESPASLDHDLWPLGGDK